MTESCEALQQKYRLLFYRGLDAANQRERFAKASAWYAVSFTKPKGVSKPCSSFGWIMSGVLCEMVGIQRFIEQHSQYPVERDVASSVLTWFNDAQSTSLQQKLSVVVPCARQMKDLIEDRIKGRLQDSMLQNFLRPKFTPGAFPRVEHLKGASMTAYSQTLFSLLRRFSSYGRKKIYNIRHRFSCTGRSPSFSARTRQTSTFVSSAIRR
jgi:hypothetical protein